MSLYVLRERAGEYDDFVMRLGNTVSRFREDPVGEVVERYSEVAVRDLTESNFGYAEVAEARGSPLSV